nr:retrovirus-related Pol polyprotein from transposon TNT 1-94 [Tanacetum cinerariifolium]
MANLSEDIQCACSDTRPPMLDRTDFASWKQCIRLYCSDKEKGVNILKLIDEGPFQMGTLKETLTEGTKVKQNRGLRDSNYDQLYAYLKQHGAHANENKMMLDRFTQHTIDPLALITSSNPRNQAIIQDDMVVVQNVQGRQNRGQGNNARGAGAASYGGAQNSVGYTNPSQTRQIKCYNCNGIGHIVRNCTHPKRPHNSEYFKDKMLLMQGTTMNFKKNFIGTVRFGNDHFGPIMGNFKKNFIGTVRFGNDHFGPIMGYGDYVIGDYVISRFTWDKFLRSKDETLEVVIKFLKQIQVGLNKTVRFIRTDNGIEFANRDLTRYYESVGIFHQKSVSRTPQQNDVVERRNCTLVEAAMTMLIFSKASMFLWAEVVATSCYTPNRSLIHSRHNKTPYKLVHNKKPDLTFLCVFGALCYPTNDSEDLGKLQPKSDIGIFVSYAPSRKGYRIYNKRTQHIIETIHIQFDELSVPMAPVQLSIGPAPTFLMPGQISSGLVPNLVPAAPYVPPTNKELEILFLMECFCYLKYNILIITIGG